MYEMETGKLICESSAVMGTVEGRCMPCMKAKVSKV